MLDKIDKELLNIIQSNFPIESRPFLALAQQLGISEEEVLERIQKFKENGYVRRMGGIFDSKKLGYCSTLCAIKVPEDRIKEVAEIINAYDGVTHNYIRNHSYNMWFTMIEASTEKIKKNIEEIKAKTGIQELLNLPAVNFFKINVNFDMREV